MFKIGDLVVIRDNPSNSVTGIVINDKYSTTHAVDGIYRYYVEWENGIKMPYREQELELVKEVDIEDWV